MNLLDWATLLSYVALNFDILLEIKKVHKTKSSKDLSLTGMTIRLLALIILVIKFISLKDLSLIVGQGLMALTFTVYLLLALSYARHRRRR
jgi:uncharacterized protein with PQ loop repeat